MSNVGPLEVIERDIGGLEYFIVPAGGMISDDLASGIIDRDDYTPEQMRAWARLFAAAPELLAALTRLIGTPKYWDDLHHEAGCGCVIHEARTAVSKATRADGAEAHTNPGPLGRQA